MFVHPLLDKESKSIVSGFDKICKHVKSTPRTLYVDKGSEFNSFIFNKFCLDHSITLIFSESQTKAAIVERSQRTLQGIMHRYMNNYSTKRYIDVLDRIVSSFNSRVNRTIKMTPNDAYENENASSVLRNLETHYKKHYQKGKLPC